MRNIVCLCALAALVGCVDREAQKQAAVTKEIVTSPVVEVSLAEVEERDLTETIEISGEIVSPRNVTVSTEVPGKLAAVYVRDGDQVEAGQIVAQMDTTQLSAQVRGARAQVAASLAVVEQARIDARVAPARSAAAINAAKARLDQAEALLAKALAGARPAEVAQAESAVQAAQVNLRTAEADLQRMEALFEEGAVSEQQVEQSRNVYAAAKSRLETAEQALRLLQEGTRPEDIAAARQAVRAAESQLAMERASARLDAAAIERVQAAEANLRVAQATLTIALAALQDASVRAPFSGRVSGQPMEPGAFVGPGTPIMRLVAIQGAYLEAELPESAISQVEPGSFMDIQMEAIPGETFRGEVVAIDPLPSAVGRLYTLRVRLLGTTPEVRPGMFARAELDLRRLDDVTVLPQAAIGRDGEQAYVFVIEDGVAHREEVKTGVRQGSLIQVIGIEPGTEVAVRGLADLFEGATVRVLEPLEE